MKKLRTIVKILFLSLFLSSMTSCVEYRFTEHHRHHGWFWHHDHHPNVAVIIIEKDNHHHADEYGGHRNLER